MCMGVCRRHGYRSKVAPSQTTTKGSQHDTQEYGSTRTSSIWRDERSVYLRRKFIALVCACNWLTRPLFSFSPERFTYKAAAYERKSFLTKMSFFFVWKRLSLLYEKRIISFVWKEDFLFSMPRKLFFSIKGRLSRLWKDDILFSTKLELSLFYWQRRQRINMFLLACKFCPGDRGSLFQSGAPPIRYAARTCSRANEHPRFRMTPPFHRTTVETIGSAMIHQ